MPRPPAQLWPGVFFGPLRTPLRPNAPGARRPNAPPACQNARCSLPGPRPLPTPYPARRSPPRPANPFPRIFPYSPPVPLIGPLLAPVALSPPHPLPPAGGLSSAPLLLYFFFFFFKVTTSRRRGPGKGVRAGTLAIAQRGLLREVKGYMAQMRRIEQWGK